MGTPEREKVLSVLRGHKEGNTAAAGLNPFCLRSLLKLK